MRTVLFAFLLTTASFIFSQANAEGWCGPGCHSTLYGACVVNGWGGVGVPASLLNECPVGTRARPPCPYGYVWRYRTCFPN